MDSSPEDALSEQRRAFAIREKENKQEQKIRKTKASVDVRFFSLTIKFMCDINQEIKVMKRTQNL